MQLLFLCCCVLISSRIIIQTSNRLSLILIKQCLGISLIFARDSLYLPTVDGDCRGGGGGGVRDLGVVEVAGDATTHD